MKKKKILFTIWTYSWGGGAENILTNLVNHLDPNKYDIDILEYYHSDIKKEPINDNINLLPPIIDSKTSSKLEKFYKMFLVRHFPQILRKKYANKDYDVEIAFTKMIPSFLLNYNKKTVIWLHGEVNATTDRKKDLKLETKCFKKASRIVTISKHNKELLEQEYPFIKDKDVLIYNSFDFSLLDYKANLEKLKESKVPILLCLCRLDWVKNPLLLLEVAKNLKEKNIPFKLQYVGHGELMDDLKAKTKKMHLEDCVEILGFKENPYPYIKNSTLLVQTSHFEGFPTIFAECTYLGKPFVCMNVGGAYELSDDNKCGFVVNNMNVEEFTNKVITLLQDKKLYDKFSKHGVKNVQRFTIDKQIKAFDEMINGLK